MESALPSDRRPCGSGYVRPMTRHVELRELLVGIEGLALLRHLYDSSNEEALHRLLEVRRLLDDEALLRARKPARQILGPVIAAGPRAMTSRATRSSSSRS